VSNRYKRQRISKAGPDTKDQGSDSKGGTAFNAQYRTKVKGQLYSI